MPPHPAFYDTGYVKPEPDELITQPLEVLLDPVLHDIWRTSIKEADHA